jgi:hypothetical protein
MASVSSLPAHLKSTGARIDDKLRDRLSAAELRARSEYAALLYDKADAQGQPPEHTRYLQAEARKVLRSLPVLEFVKEMHDLSILIGQSPAAIQGDGYSIAGLHRARRSQLKDANEYPPGLADAVDAAILGRPIGDARLAEAAEAIVSAGIVRQP